MEVGSGLDAILEGIDAQLGLLLLSYAVGLTQIASGCGVCFLVRANQIKPHLKIGELVGGRKRRAGVGLPFGLNNLGQRFVGHAALSVIAGNRLARHVARAEHQAVAGVAVVGNGDHVESLFALCFQVAPEIFGIERIERRVRHGRTFVGEDHAAMQVLELRRRGPLKSHECRELPGLVVLVGDGRVFLPCRAQQFWIVELRQWLVDDGGTDELAERRGRNRGIGIGHHRVPLGLGEWAVGIDGVAHHSQILGVIGDGEKVERRDALLRLAHVFHGLAHRVLVGILRRGAGAEGEGVHGVAAVQMQVAEVGVLERIAARAAPPQAGATAPWPCAVAGASDLLFEQAERTRTKLTRSKQEIDKVLVPRIVTPPAAPNNSLHGLCNERDGARISLSSLDMRLKQHDCITPADQRARTAPCERTASSRVASSETRFPGGSFTLLQLHHRLDLGLRLLNRLAAHLLDHFAPLLLAHGLELLLLRGIEERRDLGIDGAADLLQLLDLLQRLERGVLLQRPQLLNLVLQEGDDLLFLLFVQAQFDRELVLSVAVSGLSTNCGLGMIS